MSQPTKCDYCTISTTKPDREWLMGKFFSDGHPGFVANGTEYLDFCSFDCAAAWFQGEAEREKRIKAEEG